MGELRALIKETLKSFCHGSAHGEHSDPTSAGALTLDFPVSRTVGDKLLLSIGHPASGVL